MVNVKSIGLIAGICLSGSLMAMDTPDYHAKTMLGSCAHANFRFAATVLSAPVAVAVAPLIVLRGLKHAVQMELPIQLRGPLEITDVPVRAIFGLTVSFNQAFNDSQNAIKGMANKLARGVDYVLGE